MYRESLDNDCWIVNRKLHQPIIPQYAFLFQTNIFISIFLLWKRELTPHGQYID